MSYKIITDSACDLPKELVDKYEIDILPIYVFCGDKEYKDKVDIMPEEMFKRMNDGDYFKTAQIPPHVFKNKFTEYAEKNESCIYISFSSGLSNTYQSALIAKSEIIEKFPDFDIEVFDSKLTSGMLGLMVLKAGEMVKNGQSKEAIFRMLEHYKKHGEHIFTVDNIEYLYKGGRVSRTSAFVGGLLNIKPVFDIKDGVIRPINKVRGSKKLISKMFHYIDERQDDIKNQTIGIGHSDNLEAVEIVKNKLVEKYGCQEIVIDYFGAAVSAHTGPGILAVFFLNKKFIE